MRVAVLGQGYAGAVDAFVSANLLASDACSSLADRLAGCGGMAGDDATAEEFAASYDEAAAEALSALADLVGAFGSLGHLAQASLANHHAAEVASGGSVSSPPTRADDSVGMLVATPPTSLGGDSPALPGPVAWLLDQIEGVVWPDADTALLRSAGGWWRSAATPVSLLAAHCDTALADLADELSPEIPLAIATTEDLRARVITLSDQLAAIGSACEAYADQVDAKRDEMLDLLTDLSIELAATAVIGGALSVLSAGLAAPAAGAAGSARLAWAARELKLIVDALRLVAAGPALELRTTATASREVRTFAEQVNGARVMAIESRSTLRSLQQRPGWIPRHEHSGSHTGLEHISQSRDDLMLQIQGGKRWASAFPDQASAEATVSNLIEAQQTTVRAWLDGPRDRLRLDGDMGYPTGWTMDRLGNMTRVTGVRAVLVRDASMPDGWRLLTGFPQP
ncbi:RNase A-like domain-containing protein [Nocardioides sp. SR21]|uniref:RNase A-like domain-containing protein n=1 Tax=Nocardioides sp. SR21 TaxID=2919501 RepID=UPI001FAB05C0|nr:RNase A-like domain-containing protein [Nocardioides sp. SR21]